MSNNKAITRGRLRPIGAIAIGTAASGALVVGTLTGLPPECQLHQYQRLRHRWRGPWGPLPVQFGSIAVVSAPRR